MSGVDSIADGVYAQRKREAGMSPDALAASRMPERMANDLPNAELVYLRRGNKPRADRDTEIQLIEPAPRG